jgi:hypothetical protein
MFKFGTTCFAAAVLCAAGGAWAADGPKKQLIPNFATTDKTGWVLDRAMGPNDLVAPSTGGAGPVTFDKAHPYYPDGPRATYRVADLTNPILQPWTLPSMKKANDEVLAGKVPFRARERCWPVGVPGFDAYSGIESFFFHQMPDKVAIIAQRGPEIRHIYLNAFHSKNVKPSWYGESVGHYENGDTLVIDTIGLSAKSYIDDYRTPHTDQLHVVERMKLAADGQSIDVLAYVEDPGAFTTPYTAVQRWLRVENAPIATDQCNENNGDFFSQGLVPVPHADKPDF